MFLILLATTELKDFFAKARNGSIRLIKIVIEDGKLASSGIFVPACFVSLHFITVHCSQLFMVLKELAHPIGECCWNAAAWNRQSILCWSSRYILKNKQCPFMYVLG